MANDELMRLAERVQNLSVREDTDGGTFCAQHEQRKIAADLRALAQRAPQHGTVPEGWREIAKWVVENHLKRDRSFARDRFDCLFCSACGARRDAADGGHDEPHKDGCVVLAAEAMLATPAPEARRPGPDMSKSWPERDYMCKCSQCGSQFIGAKRQAVCKACAPKSPEAERAEGDDFTGERIEQIDGEARIVRRDRGRFVSSVPASAGQPEGVEALIRMIADDAHAITFQSMGQYRTALLRFARRLASAQQDTRSEYECRAASCKRVRVEMQATIDKLRTAASAQQENDHA